MVEQDPRLKPTPSALSSNTLGKSTNARVQFIVFDTQAAHADKKIVQLSCYVAERMLQEVTMLDYLPSIVACCAIYVARKNLGRNSWSPTLEKYTKYQVQDLMPCLNEVSALPSVIFMLQVTRRNILLAPFVSTLSTVFGCVAEIEVSVDFGKRDSEK